MNIMGSSGSEHEDESAEWRRSARCRSANANILGLSFTQSIRGRLRLRRFAASDASIHYFAGQRIYPSRVNRRHKLRVEPQSQNCLDYARQGRATISFDLGCVISKQPSCNRLSAYLDRVEAAGGPQWVDVKHASTADSLRDRSL